MRHRWIAWCAGAALTGVFSGCGGEEMKVAPVAGVVTLDGEPLDRASVLFLPDEGRPSFGVTDSDGYYTLIYSHKENGAEVGPCTVQVSTKLAPEGNRDDDAPLAPERVPKRYAKDPVRVTILAEDNTIDIKLTSQPK
jgi:hypothetical protein